MLAAVECKEAVGDIVSREKGVDRFEDPTYQPMVSGDCRNRYIQMQERGNEHGSRCSRWQPGDINSREI